MGDYLKKGPGPNGPDPLMVFIVLQGSSALALPHFTRKFESSTRKNLVGFSLNELLEVLDCTNHL